MDAAFALLPEVPPGEDELPYDFGPPMESDRHRDGMNRLIDTLRQHWAERPLGFVAGNMAIYFSVNQIRRNDFLGPDVFVVNDAVHRDRKSWVVWQEDRTPDVVIELLSARTEANDRGEKMRVYARVLHVQDYVLFDPWDARLEVYHLVDGAYVPVPPDEHGRYEVRSIDLAVGIAWEIGHGERKPWLRWFTPDGAMLPTAAELADEANHRAEQEAARAEQEAARAEQEAARAEQEAARAEQEAARAEQEATRAQEALTRADALAAQLRALGIDPVV